MAVRLNAVVHSVHRQTQTGHSDASMATVCKIFSVIYCHCQNDSVPM